MKSSTDIMKTHGIESFYGRNEISSFFIPAEIYATMYRIGYEAEIILLSNH